MGGAAARKPWTAPCKGLVGLLPIHAVVFGAYSHNAIMMMLGVTCALEFQSEACGCDLELEGLGLDLLQWLAIDLDESLAGLARGNGVGRLLAAIDLDSLWCWGGGWHIFRPI